MIGCILFSSMRIYASDVRLVNDSIKLDLKFEKSTMLEVLNTLKKKTALNFDLSRKSSGRRRYTRFWIIVYATRGMFFPW